MNGFERFYEALSGRVPHRTPVLPKIWVDLAARLRDVPFRDVIENPELAMETLFRAAIDVKSDGVRMFHFPWRKTHPADGGLIEIDDRGNALGPIDLEGGFATQMENRDPAWLEDPYRVTFMQMWQSPRPLVASVADARRIVVPDKTFYEQIGWGTIQRRLIARYGSQIAVLGDCGSATLAFLTLLTPLQQALTDMIDRPELVHAVFERGAAIAIERGKFHIDTGLKILRLNDSAANMFLISPRQWETFISPYFKMVCDELHRYDPEVKIYCHICGNSLPIIDRAFAAGVDCVGPLDPLGRFTVEQARQKAGPGRALMGGVDTLAFVEPTSEAVRRQSRQCLEQGARQGAFVLGSGCALPRSSRRENILALCEEAERFAREA